MNAVPGARSLGVLKRFNTLRGRLLAGGLALVFVMWSMDQLGSAAGPKTAKAATGTSGAHIIPDPPDRSMIEEFLANHGETTSELVIAELRDPFRESTRPSAIAAKQTLESPDLTENEVKSTPGMLSTSDKPAAQLPRLQGVMVGPKPIALIDGKSYRVGDVVAGYRIQSIDRNSVVIRNDGGARTLKLERPTLEQTGRIP